MSELVVVAYHNGSQYLEPLLDSLMYPTLVVDTGSRPDEQEYLRRHSQVESLFIQGGGCTEAYLQGYRLHPGCDHYFFMHDSMRVKERDFMPFFAHQRPVTAWIGFNMDWGTPESAEGRWLASAYGSLDRAIPPYAIFGPIFYASAAAMSAIEKVNLWSPPLWSRSDLTASERGLAIGFHRAGFTPDFLEPYDNDRIDVYRNYRFFDKYRPNRP